MVFCVITQGRGQWFTDNRTGMNWDELGGTGMNWEERSTYLRECDIFPLFVFLPRPSSSSSSFFSSAQSEFKHEAPGPTDHTGGKET